MKAVITLEENSPAKVEIEKGGACRTLFLNMQELADYIVNSVKEEEETINTKPEVLTVSPTLPPNTMKYARLSDDTDLMFLFHPQTKANVTYHGDVFKNVPFPNLVFCFGVRNKRLTAKYVLAYKDRILRDDTYLYRFPFSNVYEGGSMCYYDIDIVHDLVQLQSFPHNWLRQPFNDHLYNQESNNNLNQPLRGIFKRSQNQEFNYDMLVPTGMTFHSWAKKLLR